MLANLFPGGWVTRWVTSRWKISRLRHRKTLRRSFSSDQPLASSAFSLVNMLIRQKYPSGGRRWRKYDVGSPIIWFKWNHWPSLASEFPEIFKYPMLLSLSRHLRKRDVIHDLLEKNASHGQLGVLLEHVILVNRNVLLQKLFYLSSLELLYDTVM